MGDKTQKVPAIGELGHHHAALRETIGQARREVPFYAEHHRQTPSLDFYSQPTCSKSDLKGFGTLPLSARGLSDMYRVSATSGTTGSRLFIGYTEADWRAIREQYTWVATCIGLKPTDVLLNTHGSGLWIGAASLDELAHAVGRGLYPVGQPGRGRCSSGCESFRSPLSRPPPRICDCWWKPRPKRMST